MLQCAKFGRSAPDGKEATDWISQISDNIASSPPLDVIKDDPSDNRILECAAAGRSGYVISGDKHLLRLGSFAGKPIVPVSKFIEILQGRRQ